jgi:drug/metabolite transporter (DMT)-like permease
VLHLLALSGVLLISFSAVFVRLAAVSPVTVTFFRAAYAIPPLAILWFLQRAADRRGRRDRLVALASGLVLAADLNVWHESIGLVGAGLGTVIPNVQVVFVAIAAWIFHRERPTLRRLCTIVLVAAGVILASGLARDDAYGSHPVAGVALGGVAAHCQSDAAAAGDRNVDSAARAARRHRDLGTSVVRGTIVAAAVGGMCVSTDRRRNTQNRGIVSSR